MSFFTTFSMFSLVCLFFFEPSIEKIFLISQELFHHPFPHTQTITAFFKNSSIFSTPIALRISSLLMPSLCVFSQIMRDVLISVVCNFHVFSFRPSTQYYNSRHFSHIFCTNLLAASSTLVLDTIHSLYP